MQHTLIAVFDNRGDAQGALDELLGSGFSRQEARLSEGDPTGAPTSDVGAGESEEHSFGASIKHFFTNMFGTDNSEHAQKYSTAVTRGHYVLTVNAANEPEVERAADIVERFGPVDIDEQVAAWGGVASEAMRMGSGGQQQSGSMSQQSSGSQQGAGNLQGGQNFQGSQQRDDSAMSPSAREQLRGSVRIFHRDDDTEDSVVDDREYRRHWSNNYGAHGGNYDEYASSYQFGANIAASDQYRDHEWQDIEPTIRSDWESRNPSSAWEKFKAAVRHGWEQIKS